MSELKVEQVEIVYTEILEIQRQHPKATVTYDTEKHRINITYPLPKDYFKLASIKIENGEL